MTFHWTSLEIGTLAVEGAIFVGWLASRILGRAGRRDADVSPRRAPGARYVDADGFPGPATPRSVLGEPVRFPPRPMPPITVAETGPTRIVRPAGETFGPLAAYGQLPKRPAPRFSAPQLTADSPEVEILAAANLAIEEASRITRASHEYRQNLALMADYATRREMPKRPAVGNGGDLHN